MAFFLGYFFFGSQLIPVKNIVHNKVWVLIFHVGPFFFFFFLMLQQNIQDSRIAFKKIFLMKSMLFYLI